jgi:hypothetical protein
MVKMAVICQAYVSSVTHRKYFAIIFVLHMLCELPVRRLGDAMTEKGDASFKRLQRENYQIRVCMA